MSKTTKIIAALGVVAGLGVAALPAFTYATATISEDVDLVVEVPSAIAIEISGNNDSGDYNAVAGVNPSDAELKNTDGNVITAITGTSSSKAVILPNAIVEGGTSTGQEPTFKSTIKVTTNATGGYNLAVKATTSTSLTSGSDTIPAIAAASASFTQGTAAWGVRTAADYSSTDTGATPAAIKNDKWYPVELTDQTIRTAKASASGYTQEVSDVYYGVATDDAQPTGTYKTNLTYTATTAN